MIEVNILLLLIGIIFVKFRVLTCRVRVIFIGEEGKTFFMAIATGNIVDWGYISRFSLVFGMATYTFNALLGMGIVIIKLILMGARGLPANK